MKRKILISAAVNAFARAGLPVSDRTLRNWCKTRGIGQRIGGRWFIDLDRALQVGNVGKDGKNGQ